MSKSFNKIKRYYDSGFWNKQMVYNVVGKLLTPEEHKLITGDDYE